MKYSLLYHGAPIGTISANDARALGICLVFPLPAFEAVRPAVPEWEGITGVTTMGAAGFTEGLELRDALGALVPVTRLDLWISDPPHLLLFAQFHTSGAHVGAWRMPRPTFDAEAG